MSLGTTLTVGSHQWCHLLAGAEGCCNRLAKKQ